MSYDDAGENFRDYKGYRLTRLYPQSMWKITKDGKDIPELSGLYTQTRLAVSDIDAHIVFVGKLQEIKKVKK